MYGAALRATSGKSGIEKRMNAYVPIFSRTPARMTEPAVGASVCASGSQVWNGKIGTLIGERDRERGEDPRLRAERELRRELERAAMYENVASPVALRDGDVQRDDADRASADRRRACRGRT